MGELECSVDQYCGGGWVMDRFLANNIKLLEIACRVSLMS